MGNTNLTVGLFDGETLRHTFRAATVLSRTADEYAVVLHQVLSVHKVSHHAVTAAIVASVVPPLTNVVSRAITISFGVEPLIVGPGMKTGVPVHYDNPHDVGADRIVNAVAAFHKAQGAAIVVDLGTATTFDCISERGHYLGGAIAPGIEVGLNALMSRAAKLRPIEIAEPPRVIGRNTTHSLQSGVVFGYAGLIDGLVARLKEELSPDARVIGTGGLAPLLAQHARSLQEVDLDLTLNGLRLLYERNAGQEAIPKATQHRVEPKG